ncbi:unnamed protein product [Commensalibacter communis]|uniref:Uncharacterized protein n=1 Tax=Commensalibacter communis TaxID=2972786 RepID=A0ABN8WGP0_9PROT|nr:unnamed protein product [Commensalibacter communis]CAI3950758.1 unnamed protein product [Commensalibacter communis]CAI3952381.1 unnamed protein product [Commensalibacter communis]
MNKTIYFYIDFLLFLDHVFVLTYYDFPTK